MNKISIPFGKSLNKHYCDIIAFSCDIKTNPTQNIKQFSYLTLNIHNKPTQIFCGIKYQCVEYSRRWLILTYGITFEEINMAYLIFISPFIKFTNILSKQIVLYTKCFNGSHTKPIIGSIVVWDKTNNYITGHVAIIVNIDNTHIYIGEQNWDNNLWHNSYSRKIKLINISNQYWLDDPNQFNLKILGWLNLNNN